MIGVIFGAKGTGKTKHILELANQSVLTAKGNTIFIDSDNSYMYERSTKARFINASDYGVCTPKMLYGFLCGLSAGDFDLEYIYIDGLLNIVHHELGTLKELFAELERFADKHHLSIILSVNATENTIPDFLRPHVLKNT